MNFLSLEAGNAYWRSDNTTRTLAVAKSKVIRLARLLESGIATSATIVECSDPVARRRSRSSIVRARQAPRFPYAGRQAISAARALDSIAGRNRKDRGTLRRSGGIGDAE